MAGDNPGSIPGEVQVYLNGLLDPVLPWHQIFRRFMNRMVKTDYSFRKPNRRFFPDAILPTQHSEGLDDIAIAIDTSGSVTDDQFQQFVSEAYGILKYQKPPTMNLIQFDTRIQAEDSLQTPSDFMNVTFTGRGGTNIGPVINWAKKRKPKLLIIFTDGYFPNREPDPKVSILWIIHTQKGYKAPYGKVIDYPLK
jgi:predicted metal-dependent peptidase